MQVWQKKMQHLDRWLAGPAGQRLLALQLPLLQAQLDRYAAESEKERLIIFNGHRYQSLQHDYQQVINIAGDDEVASDVIAAPFALPFVAESIDAIILPYILEAMPNVSDVIDEAYRVLKPQGVILIAGLNAVSFLRMQRDKQLAELDLLALNDLQRELFLTGFDLVARQKFSFTSLSSRTKPLLEKTGRFFWPFLGNSFVLSMQKRVEKITPIKPKWRKQLPIKNTRLARVITERKAIGKS